MKEPVEHSANHNVKLWTLIIKKLNSPKTQAAVTPALVIVKNHFSNKMDPEEIDSWYEEQKEILFENFTTKRDTDKNAEAKYKKEMKKLRIRYEKLIDIENKRTVKNSKKSPGFLTNIINKFKK